MCKQDICEKCFDPEYDDCSWMWAEYNDELEDKLEREEHNDD